MYWFRARGYLAFVGGHILQFLNRVVLNAVVCRNTQMSIKERKQAQKSVCLKQPGLGTPNISPPKNTEFGPHMQISFQVEVPEDLRHTN